MSGAPTTKGKDRIGMNPTRERAIERLRRMVFDAFGEYEAAVWLFGSCARGEPRQLSDIDIGILPRDDLPSGFFAELAADFEESAIPYDVDLVDLRRADAALVDEVRREGVKWRGKN
jgi:predicted nucleotidyltransferase